MELNGKRSRAPNVDPKVKAKLRESLDEVKDLKVVNSKLDNENKEFRKKIKKQDVRIKQLEIQISKLERNVKEVEESCNRLLTRVSESEKLVRSLFRGEPIDGKYTHAGREALDCLSKIHDDAMSNSMKARCEAVQAELEAKNKDLHV